MEWTCDPLGPHQFDSRKILCHDDRLLAALRGETVLPVVFEISPSDVCNQNCAYCVSLGFRRRSVMLEREFLLRIVREVAQIAKAATFVGGGEPLTNTSTVDALVLAKNLGLDVGLITNGTLIRSAQVDDLVASCEFIRVSLDTVEAEEYSTMRRAPEAHLRRVLRNISALARRKALSRSSCLVGAQVVWFDQSPAELENAVRTVRELGADYLQIRPVDRAPSQGLEPNWQIYRGAREILLDLIDGYSTESFRVIPSLWKFDDALDSAGNHGRMYSGCPGGNFTCSIGADGCVYYCCTHLGNSRYALGHLRRRTLIDILNAGKRSRVISACDFRDCQAFCRNHEMNKIVHRLRQVPPRQWLREIEGLKPESALIHVNHL